jgi:hypothetical protein
MEDEIIQMDTINKTKVDFLNRTDEGIWIMIGMEGKTIKRIFSFVLLHLKPTVQSPSQLIFLLRAPRSRIASQPAI